jgi:hypothetical protein
MGDIAGIDEGERLVENFRAAPRDEFFLCNPARHHFPGVYQIPAGPEGENKRSDCLTRFSSSAIINDKFF